MSFIDLGRGRRTLVDDDVHAALGHLPWRAASNGRTGHTYVVCNLPDPETGHRLRLHREVARLGGVPGAGAVVDHINGDTLDNRRSNLRRCSAHQNASARRRSKGRTYRTPYIGVTRDRHGRAVAQIGWHGRTLRIGTYLDDVEAALARDRAARQLRGPFAVTNFPHDDGRPLLTRVDPARSCGPRRASPLDLRAVVSGHAPAAPSSVRSGVRGPRVTAKRRRGCPPLTRP